MYTYVKLKITKSISALIITLNLCVGGLSKYSNWK